MRSPIFKGLFDSMQARQKELLEKRLQRLNAENQSLRERLALFKKENIDLKRSLRERDSLFHSTPAGIILIQKGKIVDINRELLDQFGYQAEEVIGRDFLDFVPLDFKAYVRGLHGRWASGKVAQNQYETDLVTQSGETVCCDVRVKRIRFKSRTAFLLNLTRLETRKEAERKNLLAGKMDALITMSAGLAGELNRCFEDIIENADDLKTIAGSDNTGLTEDLHEIKNASKKALSTIRKLDTIARMENDNPDMISFDLKKVVKDAVALTSPKWKDEPESRGLNIDLKTYLRSGSPIEGNPEEIREAIINMILNALEAMPQGGDIHLTTEDNVGYAHIYIQDSGVGVPDQIKDRIFDPFFTTRGDDAMGLGLSMAYAIVKRHKGEIEVFSRKEQGTLFNIKLPLASPEQITKPKPDRKKIRNARILIIQAEDIIRELLSQLLINKGCRVDTAGSGMEGLGKLKKGKFDLVIADTGIPDVGGNIFLKKSRKINRKLSIVLITGYEGDDSLDHIEEEAVDLVLMKPIDVNRAVKQVSEVLMGRC